MIPADELFSESEEAVAEVSRNRLTPSAARTSDDIRLDSVEAAIAALADYRVQVAVAAQAWNGLPAGDVLTVSVTVTDPAGQSLLLSGYRTRY